VTQDVNGLPRPGKWRVAVIITAATTFLLHVGACRYGIAELPEHVVQALQ
jgi:hypothetical protein